MNDARDPDREHERQLLPVLSYETPIRTWPAWMRHAIWPAIALPGSLIYAGFSAYAAAVGACMLPRDADEPGMLFAVLGFASPLGILALTAGMLGRLGHHGAQRSNSAIRITLIVPGFATVVYVVACIFVHDSIARTLLPAAGVIAANLLVVAMLRDH